MNRTGYLNELYPLSLGEFGEPIELQSSKGWILKRAIPGTDKFDGMGCYPVFACQDWSALEIDLAQLSNQLVSLSLVTDPFGGYTQQQLLNCFDIARPYKEHFIVDLQQDPEGFVATHHRRNARNTSKAVDVEICLEPIKYLDEWNSLYNTLIERHNIQGLTRFSRSAFDKQLRVPGIVAFRGLYNHETIGMILWYVQDKVGYYHLGAYNSKGYELKTSFALFWASLGHFANEGLQWLSLGANAGTLENANDGLARFKRGWSTGTRTAYFCGRIFNPTAYHEIIETKGVSPTTFFPAYRAGEHE